MASYFITYSHTPQIRKYILLFTIKVLLLLFVPLSVTIMLLSFDLVLSKI